MVLLIIGGVGISVIFRYVLNWQSSQQDYIRFTILWVLFLTGYFILQKPAPSLSKNELTSSLGNKCEFQASSCGLMARMLITDGEFVDALKYIEKGLKLDADLHTLLQMKIVVLLHIEGLKMQDNVKQWLIRNPGDIWVRQVYAEKLVMDNEILQAYTEYQTISNILPQTHPMQKKILETIEIMRNDIDARKLISNKVI